MSYPSKIYTVGTLRYNQRQLVIVFFWLMWNDFSITLIEQIGSLTSVMMKNYGATFTQMALIGSIGGAITPWINPWVSTWSDRLRGKHGRRRPFLFYATPPFALFLMAIPFMPDLFHFLSRFSWAATLFAHSPMNGNILLIGLCSLIAGLFNAAVLAIFSYLYNDVVPVPLMGRFQALSKNVALIASLVWSFFIYGYGDKYPKWVYVGTGSFCLLIYLVSVWQIKEGEYPPPDPHKKAGVLAPLRAYFLECYSKPYYLWIFSAMLLYQIGNIGNQYQFFYNYTDLHLGLGIIGWTNGWSQAITTGFGFLCGFAVGSITDRLKPARLIGPAYIAGGLVLLLSYFIVHDKFTLLVCVCLKSVVFFAIGIVLGTFTMEIFPREKFGQFCSAQALFYQLPVNLLSVGVAEIFDHLKNNRLGYLWSAVFYTLGGLAYVKVYCNWKKAHGHTPVPHAG